MTAAFDFDVAIIGAGIAGCIAGIALAPTCRVLLLDRRAMPTQRVGECLPPAARRILEPLGLFAPFEQEHSALFQRALGMLSYWGSDQLQINDHLRNPDGFGFHLDRAAFERYLQERAEAAEVTFWRPVRVTETETEPAGCRLSLARDGEAGERSVRVKYVIDAGGRNAPFAKHQGPARVHRDRLTACWAIIPNRDTRAMGLIRAVENGWWYSAPVPNGRRVLAFQSDSDLMDSALHRDPLCFLEFGRRDAVTAALLAIDDGELDLQGMVPANSSRLPEPAGPHWAAIGDAACAFDPLSSQGMFHAMATAMQLCDLLKRGRRLMKPNADSITWVHRTYAAQVDHIWRRYCDHYRLFYGLERRFPDSRFWRRRRDKETEKHEGMDVGDPGHPNVGAHEGMDVGDPAHPNVGAHTAMHGP